VTRVIGVDACKKGWVGVTSDLRGYFGDTVDQLVATADGDGELEVVAIDIPTAFRTGRSTHRSSGRWSPTTTDRLGIIDRGLPSGQPGGANGLSCRAPASDGGLAA
jgi:hypothetical protein